MIMAKVTPDQFAAKWSQNLGAASQAIEAGVNAVTVSPGAAAARQADLWIRKLQASQAKWKTNVAKVSLSDWQQAMKEKGVPRIASGAQSAQPKMQAFAAKFLPFLDQQVAALPPRGDLEANITRLTTLVRGVSKFKNS